MVPHIVNLQFVCVSCVFKQNTQSEAHFQLVACFAFMSKSRVIYLHLFDVFY